MNLRDFVPALKFGAKIMPQDIAGMVGLPYIGNIYYIDPTNGNDATNGGKDQNDALKTLAAGYAKLADNSHDVLVLVPGGVGSGTGTIETSAINWSKNLCHLVGNVAPVPYSSRARITTSTASLSPFITISGSGNSFSGVQMTTSAATGLVTMKITGGRNNFSNCHIGGSNAVAFDTASACDILLSACSENYFSGCTIGFDTVSRTAAIGNVTTENNAERTIFDDCIFPMAADAAAPFFVKVPASGLQTFMMFRRCAFINNTATGSTTMTDAFSINAAPMGPIICQDCFKIGTTGWADTAAQVYLIGASSNSTYNQGIGFAVNPAA